eukprot:TRINITY_DN7598_c0_g1_i1.p1 TRINITY_DN7598_c0_g1~~TRINITY_DN7598_c0_g1_i1.p1  ORF type:complete len:90 (-),score=3.09 TRINITY_DN7598_c0_g1_i1:157-426(-)
MEEMTLEEKTQFLRFVWARERIPRKNDEQFRLGAMSSNNKKNSNPNNRLPQSQTCFFKLAIPQYTEKKGNERETLLCNVQLCSDGSRLT